MGRLIKNHWARLVTLTAAVCQTAAGLHGIFWPKIFWDFLTTNLDGAVKPVPILQIINILLGLAVFALEWPLPIFTAAAKATGLNNGRSESKNHHDRRGYSANITGGRSTSSDRPSKWQTCLATIHKSIEARLLFLPLNTLAALLLYQGTSAGLYYLIAMGVYFWAFSEGEIIMGTPWTLPRRSRSKDQIFGAMKV